jgi:sugar lactone lactonase YvrE
MFKLSLALLLCVSALSAGSARAADLSTVALFNPAAFESPESVQFDRHGNAYISLALTGEVRKIAPGGAQTTLAFLPIRPDVSPCGNAFGLPIMGAVALDHQGNVYASVNSCEPSQLGVWKVTPSGAASLVAGLPQGSAPNGIAYHDGWLYVADTLLGRVWRIHSDGSGAPEVWTADPLLTPLFIPLVPGPNGLQIFRGEVYVAVSDRDRLRRRAGRQGALHHQRRLPLLPRPHAAPPEPHAARHRHPRPAAPVEIWRDCHKVRTARGSGWVGLTRRAFDA